MVYGGISRKKKLFHDKPKMTVDNYFVTDAVPDWAGNNSIGIIGKNARNRPPKDIKPLYIHKDKNNTTMKHAKTARLFEPIVAVKNIQEVFSVCMFRSNQHHPLILYLLML